MSEKCDEPMKKRFDGPECGTDKCPYYRREILRECHLKGNHAGAITPILFGLLGADPNGLGVRHGYRRTEECLRQTGDEICDLYTGKKESTK